MWSYPILLTSWSINFDWSVQLSVFLVLLGLIKLWNFIWLCTHIKQLTRFHCLVAFTLDILFNMPKRAFNIKYKVFCIIFKELSTAASCVRSNTGSLTLMKWSFIYGILLLHFEEAPRVPLLHLWRSRVLLYHFEVGVRIQGSWSFF